MDISAVQTDDDLLDFAILDDSIKSSSQRTARKTDIEFLSPSNEENNSDFVPMRLKPEIAKKLLKCQKTMLIAAFNCYKKSVGTSKENYMKKMYKDAIIDYNRFIMQHRTELLEG